MPPAPPAPFARDVAEELAWFSQGIRMLDSINIEDVDEEAEGELLSAGRLSPSRQDALCVWRSHSSRRRMLRVATPWQCSPILVFAGRFLLS